MNRSRDEFLSGARLAGNEDCRIAAGNLWILGTAQPVSAGEAPTISSNIDALSTSSAQRDVFLLQPLLGPLAIVDICTGEVPPDQAVPARREAGLYRTRNQRYVPSPFRRRISNSVSAGVGQRTIDMFRDPFEIVRMNLGPKGSLPPLVETDAVIRERHPVCIQALTLWPQDADHLRREIQHLLEFEMPHAGSTSAAARSSNAKLVRFPCMPSR